MVSYVTADSVWAKVSLQLPHQYYAISGLQPETQLVQIVLPQAHDTTIKVIACCTRLFPQLIEHALVSRQVQKMHEQAAAQTAEVRKLYDWRDVMKTVHNERLQELAAKHHADRDSLLQTISQRSALCQSGPAWSLYCI